MEEAVTTSPPKQRKPRRGVPLSPDPELRYLYKKKPGPKPKGRKKVVRVSSDPHPLRAARQRARIRKCVQSPKWLASQAEKLAALRERQKRGECTRRGVPDGMRREEATALWTEARERAEELFMELVQQGVVTNVAPEDYEPLVIKVGDKDVTVLVPKTDEAKAAIALKEAMVLVLSPMSNHQAKTANIRTVLEWTKAKPASKQEVALTKAEDWLAAIAADDQNGGQS